MVTEVNNILVGCEESGVVTTAFRDSGYDAISCDLLPTRGNSDWHIQDDIMNVLPSQKWSLVILHPDCTCLALSGNRWYGFGSSGYEKRLRATAWTLQLWNLAIENSERVALENPLSVIFDYLPNVQYVQPWQFGHEENKKTGFALHNLPMLRPTKLAERAEDKVHKMAPGANRKRDRSVTYTGIAQAMAEQWGPYCLLRAA